MTPFWSSTGLSSLFVQVTGLAVALFTNAFKESSDSVGSSWAIDWHPWENLCADTIPWCVGWLFSSPKNTPSPSHRSLDRKSKTISQIVIWMCRIIIVLSSVTIKSLTSVMFRTNKAYLNTQQKEAETRQAREEHLRTHIIYYAAWLSRKEGWNVIAYRNPCYCIISIIPTLRRLGTCLRLSRLSQSYYVVRPLKGKWGRKDRVETSWNYIVP